MDENELDYELEVDEEFEKLLDKTISLRELQKLTEDYDEDTGEYPESKYEGESVFDFIIDKLKEEGGS